MLLVVGLGNPGKEYAKNRHNVGFVVLDEIARRSRADSFREKFSAEWVKIELAGEPIVLLKPMTFMNDSGDSVQPAMAFFKIEPKDVIVVHDELDVPFGEVRLKFGGGHAGHNGLRSILDRAGTPDFGRIRVGISRPPPPWRDVADYVLANFSSAETAELPGVIKKAADAIVGIAKKGFPAAMKAANTVPKPPKPPKVAPTE